ncbi:MAG: hypothetical protein A2Y77_00995 [Planctomycetes bacterium RBG_13_62_9]|nr:MAG: hypothetical protein A2Y77_00995 [Planctomycetes bacterium RBG_13_62_9]
MAEETKSLQARLIRYLLTVLDGRGKHFAGIVAKSHNCDPAVLMDALQEMETRGLVRTNGEGSAKEYVLTAHAEAHTWSTGRLRQPTQSQDSEQADHGVLESNYFRDLVRAVYGSLPEPGLVYSQWWFSEPTYARLVDLLLRLTERETGVAFVGAPTLAAVFSQCAASPATIIDIDDVLLKRIAACVGKQAQSVCRDISHSLDTSLKGEFDVVVSDPPWSSHSLRTFFVRSSEMLAPEGTLVISFPPVFTRPSAQAERRSLLRMADTIGLSLTNELTGFTEYNVPPFEYRAYREHDIELVHPWRKGDLFVFKKSKRFAESVDVPVKASWVWDQFDYGTTRLFLKKNGSAEEGPARILPLSGKYDFAYDSTSSRTQLWKQACLVSTRNQIADVSGTKQLTAVLRELLGKTADLSNVIRCLSSVPPETRAALSIILSDPDGKNSERGESIWQRQKEKNSETFWRASNYETSNHTD